MNSPLNLFVAAALLCASPCIAGDAKNDFDPDVDFTRFKTFSIVGGIDFEKSGWLDEPEMHERFKNFVSGALEMRGLHEVPADAKPSLAVRFWVARRQKQEVTVYTTGPWGGYSPYWTGVWAYSYQEYVVDNYVQGSLIVDLIDPATKELVWRTYLRQKIEDRAKAYNEAKKNLYKAMAGLPPSSSDKEKMRGTRAKLEARYK
jgi:hypothetical protein